MEMFQLVLHQPLQKKSTPRLLLLLLLLCLFCQPVSSQLHSMHIE
jgi:hypothetical protein